MGKNKNQINVKLTDEQKEIVEKLVGPMGGTEAEVIRNIIVCWLSEKSIMSEIIKKRWLNGKS
jgi:predicted DNA-binding protein